MSFLLRQVASDRLNFLNCTGPCCFCFLILATLPAPHGQERQNSDKSPAPTLPIKRSSKRCANSSKLCALEHVPKILLDFIEKDMLQLFDFERVLTDPTVPFDRDPVWRSERASKANQRDLAPTQRKRSKLCSRLIASILGNIA
jgi:hypothetical protein